MNEDGSISKCGYNMVYFFKFVWLGYYWVDVIKNLDINMFVLVYKGDNKVVIVVINCGILVVS